MTASANRLDWSMIPGTRGEQVRLAKSQRKPIKIEKRGRGQYAIVVFGIYIGSVKNRGEAQHAAHTIGRYKLDLGDFVHTYTEGY